MRFVDDVRVWRPAVAWVLAGSLAVLAGACGGAQAAAGEMLSVLHDEATVDGDAAAAGDSIPTAATLATDADGVARFRLTANDMSCHMFQEAAVELSEADSVLRFVRGKTLCTAASETDEQVKVGTDRFDLTFTEARFGVDLTGDDPVVVLDEGRMRLETFEGAERRPVDTLVMSSAASADEADDPGSTDDDGDATSDGSDTTLVAYTIRPDNQIERTPYEYSENDAQVVSWLSEVGEEQIQVLSTPSEDAGVTDSTDAPSDATDTDADASLDSEGPEDASDAAGGGNDDGSEATGEGGAPDTGGGEGGAPDTGGGEGGAPDTGGGEGGAPDTSDAEGDAVTAPQPAPNG
jgi:hypothetical protein